jgi:hypothetical protein
VIEFSLVFLNKKCTEKTLQHASEISTSNMHAWIRHGRNLDPHGMSSMIKSTVFNNCLVVSAETGLKQLDSTIPHFQVAYT